jgi:DNA-binding response OmpR family regulator
VHIANRIIRADFLLTMKKKCNILIIEDDPDIGGMIKMILDYKGYSPFVVANTQRINEVIKNNRTDVIIMDMLLSGANGTDICIEIKKDDSLAHIPLIMMSAHPDAESLCKKAGADDFVSKPFDLDDLLLKIGCFTATECVSK